MKLSKQEYIAVMFDHDTGRWSVETDLIPDLTGSGDVWDNATNEWDWIDSLGVDGVYDSMTRIRALKELIEGEDING
jgi:hypothetical protein